ncbi:A disintegrin and metalloproteinase with thrombospondin motifs 7-like [Andrena cerasifolii]|uniref:A disintegrin and metalloproteinase with thrombospondin motifs 7-like n=1 Tax=Andrena cerasifolii TaxID=2819439 RepID=UPI0040383445
MNGYQALLTFLGILVTAGSDLSTKYSRGPGNVYHGRYTRDLHQPEFLIPRRVLGDGSFNTYSLPNYYDRRELNERRKRSTEADKLHLVLPFNGIEHHVELTPYHEFISPDMVIETRGAGLRTNFNEAVRFKRAPDRQCHYRGIIRGHRASRAALSLCDGVVGYVHTNQGRYFIEPALESEPEQDGQHVHVAYKRNAPHEEDGHDNSSMKHCETDGTWEAAWAEELARREKRLIEEGNPVAEKRARPAKAASSIHSVHRYIEIGLVADRKFLDYHNNTNYEQFLLAVMNMVADYYHDVTVGNQIDVVLVRMIYLEKEKEEIDLTISPQASETLASFANWAMRTNPADHDHPNHYDVGVLVTRHDICSKKSGCSLTGLAYLAAACDPAKAASINEESGLLLGVVIAHEVGHVMGSSHDDAKDANAGCQPHDKDGSYFIMSPIVALHTIRWSPCSRAYITNLLDSGLGDCLNDNPKNPSEKLKLPNMLPGAMYDGDYQCNLVFPGSKVCPTSKADCDRLWCTKDPPDTGCRTLGATVADGTKCGENKWCIHLKCVEKGSRPAAVNGGWGAWGPLSACSRTCGGGIKVSERECDKPIPANGGRYCLGERRKITFCNTAPCDVTAPSFRSVQCSMYDKIQVLTDGLHTWRAYMSPNHDPCVLFCSDEKYLVSRVAPLVNDSTPCRAGTNDVCISGGCRKVGCDWVLDSPAIEDKCGVCKGDGKRCKLVEGHFTEKNVKEAFKKIVSIPKDARQIHIWEDAVHKNFLTVKLEKNNSYCLNGKMFEDRSADYLCADFLIVYLHPEPHKEEILIKGPISEDIRIEYAFMDPDVNVGVHYSYATVSDDPSYVPKYLWDFLEWSDCNAMCGGGTKISEASCIEQNGGAVSPGYCKGMPKPEPKSRTCNTDPCPAKWRVSQWSKCSACDNNKGSRHRKVQCVRPAARFGEDDVQANLDACKGRVPRQKEDCIGKRPCKKTCPKKARNVNAEPEAEKEKQWTSVEDQAKMIDRFVDLNLARYLEKAHGMSREDDELARASGAADFRQLLRDWSTIENKKKRRDCIPVNLTLPKPGSIAVDSVPIESVVVVEAPIMTEGLQMNISDRAYQETGDVVRGGLDTTHEKVYRGEAAVKKLDEIRIKNKYTNATYVPPSKEENYSYDRLSSIVDAVDQ